MAGLEHIHFVGSVRPTDRGRERPVAREGEGTRQADPGLDPFLTWVLQAAGLNSLDYRPGPLVRRLPACLRLLHVKSPQEAQRALEQNPELLPKVISALLLGVSAFFRDRQAFDTLARRVLPELISRTSSVRIWSAACSDGQELYSTAILLDQLNGLEGAQLLGTDYRAEAIGRAKQGRYPASGVADLNATLLERYLVRRGDEFEVIESIRRRIDWQVGDLTQEMPAGTWDLVLWRNMAIYLNPQVANAVWKQMVSKLNSGGYLVTGKAERPPAELKLRRIENCVYEKA